MQKKVMILDGGYSHSLALATEIKHDFQDQVHILAVGTATQNLVLESRYCDTAIFGPSPTSQHYADELLAIVSTHEPDVLIPVGYRSVAALAGVLNQLRSYTHTLVPPAESTSIALNKIETLKLAERLGIRVPQDFTSLVRAALGSGDLSRLESLPYPVFLKLAEEIGGNLLGLAKDSTDLIQVFKRMATQGFGDNILIQEFIDAEPYTYGCALLYSKGRLVQEFQHVETRSVPPLGGSATRAHIKFNDEVAEASKSILESLNWEGPALVEFKKDQAGQMVLMEINPKFWASYTLASSNGYRFGTAIVQEATGLLPKSTPKRKYTGSMVFPIREMKHSIKHGSPMSILKSGIAMLYPPARWDVRFRDLPYYLKIPLAQLPRRGKRSLPDSDRRA